MRDRNGHGSRHRPFGSGLPAWGIGACPSFLFRGRPIHRRAVFIACPPRSGDARRRAVRRRRAEARRWPAHGRRRSARAAAVPRRGASPRARRGTRPAARARGAAAPRWRCRAGPGRRHSTPHVRPSRAATCSRRSARSSCVGSHANAAPHSGACSACSNAHSASFGDCARTMTRRARSMPAAASAGAYGRYGGAIHTTSRPAACTCASAGSVSRNSPMPSRSSRNSVSAPCGQPRPGSAASSAA